MRIPYIYFIIVFFIVSCGESEEEIMTRKELSSIVRQTNVKYDALVRSMEQEKSISQLTMKGFYQDQINDFEDIRLNFSKINIEPKFDSCSILVYEILAITIDRISIRQQLMLNSLELSNEVNSVTRDIKSFSDSKESFYLTDNRYSKKYHLDKMTKLITDMSNGVGDVENREIKLDLIINDYDSINQEIYSSIERANFYLNELNFKDTLNVDEYINSDDFLIQFAVNLENMAPKLLERIESLAE